MHHSSNSSHPLVGKLEIFFATLRSKRISDFDVRWGNSGHSLGSLLTNLMILETMLSSDFFSDLSLLSYKYMVIDMDNGACLHSVAV